MSKERQIRFTTDEDVINNQIPIQVQATLGTVFFQSERRPKYAWDKETGVQTDEIVAQQIECISEKQETTFNVDLPADFDLESLKLKSWDELILEGVEYVEPWAILQQGEFNVNEAMLGYSVKAKGIKKGLGNAFSKESANTNENSETKKTENVSK